MTAVFSGVVVFNAVKRPIKKPTKEPLISKYCKVKCGDLNTVIKGKYVGFEIKQYRGVIMLSAKIKRSPVVAKGEAKGVICADAMNDDAIKKAHNKAVITECIGINLAH